MACRSQDPTAEDDATMPINGDHVSESLERLEGKIDALDKKVDALGNAMKVQFEQVREDIKTLGEGYEQGLKQIARQISDLGAKWSDKWSLHDIALKNHGKRITALERREK
jgi:hypothetical protein